MFADDLLLIFARADQIYIKLLFKAFNQFSHSSGLAVNLEKSDIYLTGIPDTLKH